MACLCGLQASNILTEVDRTKLFGNVPEIYAANRYFWTKYILTMLNTTRTTRTPLDSGHLLQGFTAFEKVFGSYTKYCSEQSKCQQYCRDRFNDNELFTAYLVVRTKKKNFDDWKVKLTFFIAFEIFFVEKFEFKC